MSLVAAATVTLALTAIAVAATLIRRGALAAAVALLFVIAPFAVERLTAILIRAPHVTWFDLRLPFLLVPGGVALVVAWLATRRRPFRWLAIWAWCSFSGVANTYNGCNPGWCGWYGFPLPYYSWSDVILVINGERPSFFHPIALAVDVAVFAAGVIGFARLTSRVP